MHDFCSCHPESTSLESLALVASGAPVPGLSRTVASRETVLTRLSSLGSEGAGGNTHLPIFPQRCIFSDFKRCCLRVRLPIRLHPGADRDPPLWDPGRSWHNLSYWKPTKNKGCLLDNHKGFRENQELWQLNDKVQRTTWWWGQAERGKVSDGGQKVQTSNHKVSPGDK